MRLLLWPLKLFWYALVIALPVLGFWLASTLTIFLNGPKWLPWLAGALAVLLPLLWEVESQFRFSRKLAQRMKTGTADGKAPERILKVGDRVILRTMALNLVFLAIQLGAFPQKSFAALATRGDWMLEGQKGNWVPQTRESLFKVANGLEVLYDATRQNPYSKMRQPADTPEPETRPQPGDLPHSTEPPASDGIQPDDTGNSNGQSQTDTQSPAPESPQPEESAAPAESDTPPETPSSPESPASPSSSSAPKQTPPASLVKAPSWPLPDRLHPAIEAMPKSAETSIHSVAAYIGEKEPAPFGRVKAIYDWLASRISYDVPALMFMQIPNQDAESVFRQRTGVCAGYANLFKALAGELGIPAEYVTGDTRTINGDIAGVGHAWNAVQVGGKWYLLDATWGAGYVDGDKFTRRYTSAYLLTPPEIFSIDHYPEQDQWQLRQPLLDRGDFARQPMLRASFFKRGWQLVSPTRSQVSVQDQAVLKLKNNGHQYLLATLDPVKGGSSAKCQVTGMSEVKVSCPVPGRGSYRVMLYANTSPSGSFEYVGQLDVVSG